MRQTSQRSEGFRSCGLLGLKDLLATGASCLQEIRCASRAAMVLSSDERRELRRLLDKMDSSGSLPSGGNVSMTDGAKRLRLRDIGGCPEDGSAAKASAANDQLPVMKAAPISKASMRGSSKLLEFPEAGDELIEAVEDSGLVVISYAGAEVDDVPFPDGIQS